MELFLPWNWDDRSGWVIFMIIFAVIVVGIFAKLAGAQWDDWLDEQWGRGSIRDYWLFDRIDRDRRKQVRSDRRAESRRPRRTGTADIRWPSGPVPPSGSVAPTDSRRRRHHPRGTA